MSKNTTAISAAASREAGPSGGDRVTRAISFTLSQPSTPPDGCYRCHREIYFSFFFDGFGKASDDIDSLSNIARLYLAHKETDENLGVYRLYYEGMGRKLSGETVGIATRLAKKAYARSKEAGLDNLKGSVKDAGNEAGKTAAIDLLENVSKVGVKSATGSAILHGMETFKEALKPRKVLDNLKAAAIDPLFLLSQGTFLVADSIPLIRDTEVSAAYLGTGLDARVEKAIRNFTTLIEQAKKSDLRPIKTIRIAVFGYDRGAIIARKFANELIEETCKRIGEKITYGDAEVTFDFMGLFDSVSSAYADSIFAKVLAPVLSWTASVAAVPELGPGAGAIARVGPKAISFVMGLARRTLGEYDTPGEFRKIVHHVAATELRFFKQLDSPRNAKETGNLTEVVYPGSQSDVGGGFVDGEDGKSADLSRVSARNMLDQAWAYGVPMRRPDEMKVAGDLDTLKHFAFTKQCVVNEKSLTANDLFRVYASMLPTGTGTLEHHFLAHQKLFISWARTVHDRAHALSTGNNLFINTVDSDVYNAIFSGDPTPGFKARADYYTDVSAKTLPPSFGGERRSVDDISDPIIKELATAWVKPIVLSPEVIAFFDTFVHNTITRLNNVSLGDGVFLTLREIEDKSRQDQLTDMAEDAVRRALPDVDQIRQDSLKKLRDAGTWSEGSQRYPDPLALGPTNADLFDLTNVEKD